MSAAYRIKPVYNELRVEFEGALSDNDATELERELQRMIAVMPVGRYNVLMDMMGMTNYSTSARDVLVRVQKSFAEFAKRTAYVANRPNLLPRSLARRSGSGFSTGNAKIIGCIFGNLNYF